MSKIPFPFIPPVPKFFKEKGFLKNLKNRAFISWCFERCSSDYREVTHDNQVIVLKPYQFIFGRNICCEETGLSDDEVRTQQKRWEKLFYLKKAPNKTPNRFTVYEWSTEYFLNTNPQVNTQQTPNKPPTEPPQTRTIEPIDVIEQTEQQPQTPSSENGLFVRFGLVGLSKEENEFLATCGEYDFQRAEQVMNEAKQGGSRIKSNKKYLISALRNDYVPKLLPTIHLSENGKKNKNSIFSFFDQFHSQIAEKDIKFIDYGNFIKIGITKIFYEMEVREFGKEAYHALEKYNLSHLIKKQTVPKKSEKITPIQSMGDISQDILKNLKEV